MARPHEDSLRSLELENASTDKRSVFERYESVASRTVSDEAVEAVARLKTVQENHTLSRDDLVALSERVFQFCTEAAGLVLYPYQAEFGKRVILSLLLDDGEEITALFSRQAGKTETLGTIIPGLMMILPKLAELPGLDQDARIRKFAQGVWVGLFAPSSDLTAILASRMRARMNSPTFKEVASDPDIALAIPDRASIAFPNGSFVHVNSAGPQSNIEGKTYHLVVIDECQYVSNYKIKKSIHPMLAATNGTIVKIGTPAPRRNDFFDACSRGRRKSIAQSSAVLRTHFEYDYSTVAKYNPRYLKYIRSEIERLGYESDEFRMSYRLHWILERGQFIEPDLFDSCGIKERDFVRTTRKKKIYTFSRPDYPITQDQSTENMVAALDIGRSHDSTVLTVGRVWWDNPVDVSGEVRYYLHVANWLEIQGDDHESQYPKILDFLANYKVGRLIVDATGRGDPVYDRLRFDLSDKGVRVDPFVFNQSSKHNGYTLLYQEILAKRLSYPAAESARRMRKWQRFVQQMYDLEKNWHGKYMVVAAPPSKGRMERAHDDYPDSLMMLCWAVNRDGNRRVDVSDNPFFGPNASSRWERPWFAESRMARYSSRLG